MAYPLVLNEKFVSFHNQIYYWVYLQNFALTFNWTSVGPLHLWSLAVEEHFYLIWPLLVYLLDIKWLKKIISLIIIFSFLLRIYFSFKGLEVFYFTFTRFDELALGGLLAILEIEGYLIKENINKFLRLFLMTVLPTLILWIFFTGLKNPMIQIIIYNLLSFTYFCVLALTIITADTKVHKMLKNNFFNYSGKISYGLYVWHPMCFLVYHKFANFGIIIDFIFSFILTYIISFMSFYIFENRFLKFKKYFV